MSAMKSEALQYLAIRTLAVQESGTQDFVFFLSIGLNLTFLPVYRKLKYEYLKKIDDFKGHISVHQMIYFMVVKLLPKRTSKACCNLLLFSVFLF